MIAVFDLPRSSISICKYPEFSSDIEKILSSAKEVDKLVQFLAVHMNPSIIPRWAWCGRRETSMSDFCQAQKRIGEDYSILPGSVIFSLSTFRSLLPWTFSLLCLHGTRCCNLDVYCCQWAPFDASPSLCSLDVHPKFPRILTIGVGIHLFVHCTSQRWWCLFASLW